MSQYQKELGKGSWGTVYKVDEKTAIKIFNKSSYFISTSEIDILFRLKSPYILKGLEIVNPNNEVGITMELGHSTLNKLKKNIDQENLIHISYQLVCAVSYLHSHGYYHLDLNTTNCICFERQGTPKYQIKLIDFGLSGAVTNNGAYITHNKRITITERPPECFDFDKYYNTADVWSLGMIFIDIFTGQLPYIIDWDHTSDNFKNRNKLLWSSCKDNKESKEYNKLNAKMYDDCVPKQIKLLFKDNPNFIDDSFKSHFPNEQWLILLKKMLKYNPADRITIYDIQKDSVFDESKQICQIFHPEIIPESYDFDLSNLNFDNLLQIKSILSYIHTKNNISVEALFIAIEMSLKILSMKRYISKLYIFACINISLRIFDLYEKFKTCEQVELEVIKLLKGKLRTSIIYEKCQYLEQLKRLYNYIFSDVEILKKYFDIDWDILISEIKCSTFEDKNTNINNFSLKLKIAE